MKRMITILALLTISNLTYAPTDNTRFARFVIRSIEENMETRRLQARERRINILLRTIRIVESSNGKFVEGDSGENGAYQFTKPTWRRYSQRYFGEIIPMTLDNQDMIARRKVEELVDAGLSDLQIGSYWNCGKPDWEGRVGINNHGVRYDVPNHVRKFERALVRLNSAERN